MHHTVTYFVFDISRVSSHKALSLLKEIRGIKRLEAYRKQNMSTEYVHKYLEELECDAKYNIHKLALS